MSIQNRFQYSLAYASYYYITIRSDAQNDVAASSKTQQLGKRDAFTMFKRAKTTIITANA